MKVLKSKSFCHLSGEQIIDKYTPNVSFISFESAIGLFRDNNKLGQNARDNNPIGYRITEQGIEILFN